MKDRVICLDAGHGGTAETDSFRVGPAGEREEWVNLRVGLELQKLLEEAGAQVIMTRKEDVAVGLKDRADMAIAANADMFLSLHHNATADPAVNFPIVYYHGEATENLASAQLAQILAEELRDELFEGKGPISVVSDKTIFPNSGTSVLRNSYGIPGVIGEASFFTNPEEEQRLKNPAYNKREADAYFRAIKRYFKESDGIVHEKNDADDLEPFEAFQEAERMNETAKQWEQNFEKGRSEYEAGNYDQALHLLELSARAFPDSPVARDAHAYRAKCLDALGKLTESEAARRRVEEYYFLK